MFWTNAIRNLFSFTTAKTEKKIVEKIIEIQKSAGKVRKFLIALVQNIFFLSLLVEKEIIANICKKMVDSEFEIGDTIG